MKANDSYTAATLAAHVDDTLPAHGLPLTFSRTYQETIIGRYTPGLLGLGWTSNWDISAIDEGGGTVLIQDAGVLRFFTHQPGGSFRAGTGDHGTLTESG